MILHNPQAGADKRCTPIPLVNKKTDIIRAFRVPRSTLDDWIASAPEKAQWLDDAVRAVKTNPTLLEELKHTDTALSTACEALGIMANPFHCDPDERVFKQNTLRVWSKTKWPLFLGYLLGWYQQQLDAIEALLSPEIMMAVGDKIGKPAMIKLHSTDKESFALLCQSAYQNTLNN